MTTVSLAVRSLRIVKSVKEGLKQNANNRPQCSKIYTLEETAPRVSNASHSHVTLMRKMKSPNKRSVLEEKRSNHATQALIVMPNTIAIGKSTSHIWPNASCFWHLMKVVQKLSNALITYIAGMQTVIVPQSWVTLRIESNACQCIHKERIITMDGIQRAQT